MEKSFYLHSFFEKQAQQLLSQAHSNYEIIYKHMKDSADWHSFFAHTSKQKIEPMFWNNYFRQTLFERFDLWQYPSYRTFLEGLQDSKTIMLSLFEQACQNKNVSQLRSVAVSQHQSAYDYLIAQVAQYSALEWFEYFQQKYNIRKPLSEWSSQDRIKIFKDAENYLGRLYYSINKQATEVGLVQLLKSCPEYESQIRTWDKVFIAKLLREETLHINFHDQLKNIRAQFDQEYKKYLFTIEHKKKDLEHCKTLYKDAQNCSKEFKAVFEAREKVLEMMLKHKQDRATRIYDDKNFTGSFISPHGKDFLTRYNLFDSLREFSGDILQHQLHAEMCALANSFADLLASVQNIPQVIGDIIAEHIKHAHECLIVHNIQRASIILDFCWGFLSYLKGNVSGIYDVSHGYQNGYHTAEYMHICISTLNTYAYHNILNPVQEYLKRCSIDQWQAYSEFIFKTTFKSSDRDLHSKKLFENLHLYRYENFLAYLKQHPEFETNLLAVGDKIAAGELKVDNRITPASSLDFIQKHLDSARPELWAQLEQRTSVYGDAKIEHVPLHRFSFPSYQAYAKSLSPYKDQMIDLYQKISAGDATTLQSYSKMPAHERGIVLGYVSSEYHRLTEYANCDHMFRSDSLVASQLDPLQASLNSSQSTSIATDMIDFKTFWKHYIQGNSPTNVTSFAVPLQDSTPLQGGPEFHLVIPVEQSSVSDARIRHGRFSEHCDYERRTKVWQPIIYDSKMLLKALHFTDMDMQTIRNYLHHYLGAYPEHLPSHEQEVLFRLFDNYRNPAYMQMLRNLPDSNFHFAHIATIATPKQFKKLPQQLKNQLNSLTAQDWSHVLKTAQKYSGFNFQNFVYKLYRYKNFKECLKQQFPEFNYAMIDWGIKTLEDESFYNELKTYVDADKDTIANYVRRCLEKADFKTMQDYCQWRYGRSVNDLLPEQKQELFTKWSAWSSYSYINLLRSMRDFESFVLKAVQDKQLMKQLAKYQSLEGRGTIAEHMRSLAKGFFEGYHGNWHNTSFYNGQRPAAMYDLLPEERYHFYRDPFMFTHQEGAEYLKSYGREYDAWMRRLSYELEDNTALKQQFANITAHDGYKMLDYVQREAYQAQKRYEHEMQQATYDLAQHLETLNQLKVDYLKKAEQELYLPTTRERFINRAQAIESFISGNQTVSVCNYQITQEAKKIIQKLGLNEYELRQFTGNVIQQELHGELITIINEAGKLKNALTGQELTADQLGMLLHTSTDYIGEYVSLAHEYNKSPQTVEKAWAVSDICWGFLDCCYAAVQGVGDGFCNVKDHIKEIFKDPVGAAERYAQGIATVAQGMFKILYEIESLSVAYEQGAEQWENQVRDVVEHLTPICQALQTQIRETSPRDMVRNVTAALTETLIGNRLRTVTKQFFASAKNQAIALGQKIGEKLTNKSPILKTAEGAHVRIADKAAKKYYAAKNKSNSFNGSKNNQTPKVVPVYTYKNGKYLGAKYHHPNSKGPEIAGTSKKGIKSPAPKDGQTALDNSVQVKDKGHYDRRVGTSNGEIVVLDGDLRNGYHGHVRTWEELISDPDSSEIIKALKDYGFVNKKGNILK
jgi:hypothetical protein